MTVQCCSCKKVRDGKQWIDVRESGLSLDLGVSHGYCPVCATNAFSAIREELMRAKAAMPLRRVASS